MRGARRLVKGTGSGDGSCGAKPELGRLDRHLGLRAMRHGLARRPQSDERYSALRVNTNSVACEPSICEMVAVMPLSVLR